MKSIAAAFKRQLSFTGKYPYTTALLAACCGLILVTAYQNGNLQQAVAYIGGGWFCCLLTDIVVIARPMDAIGYPIKKTVKSELWTIAICQLLGAGFLVMRFFTDWQHFNGIIKIAALCLLPFMFQIPQALIYLLRYKYKPRELGINLHYWYLPVLLHLVWGALTLWIAPERSHWTQAYTEYGILGSLFMGFISAALPEEFMRLLWQTRIGKLVGSPAFGIFFAAALWGAMHIPVAYSQQPGKMTAFMALEATIYLVPLGMFWGYLTHRTRSIMPSLTMHGLNLWGLQNF